MYLFPSGDGIILILVGMLALETMLACLCICTVKCYIYIYVCMQIDWYIIAVK